jgi:hypothetical protein
MRYTAEKDSDHLRKLTIGSAKSKKLQSFPYAYASTLVTNQLLDLFGIRASSTYCGHFDGLHVDVHVDAGVDVDV